MTMQLVIGNKNYSSWSMRPWVLLRHFGIPFTEHKLRFDFKPGSAFYAELARITPAGKVPVLLEDDGFAVWDTLAIVEYIADLHPEHTVWPREARPRARARSLCAEMHAGFTRLRSLCPMNIEAPLQHLGSELFAREEGLRGDLARVGALIEDALRASGGPFLFGAFGAVDAYYAPVAMRVRGYGLPVSDTVASYVKRLAKAVGVREWVADALAEHDFVAEEEPYRQASARHRPNPVGG
jgi:glutathione S-transferase